MSSFDSLELIKLNSHTVSMMVQGDHTKAGPALRSTMNALGGLLEYLQNETNEMELENSGMMVMDTVDGASITANSTKQSICFHSVHEGLFATKMGHPQGGVMALFDKAVHVLVQEGTDLVATIRPWNSLIEVTAAILYNAGLFCHLKGAKSGQTSFIQKALKYYTWAHQILSSWDHDDDGSEMNLMLGLAILNNLGHAEYMLGNFDTAYELYREIEPLVLECLIRISDEDMHDFLQKNGDVMDFFLVTSCVGSPRSFSISPAA